MAYTTLIQAADLRPHLGDPDWVIIDCRFDLTDPEQGRRDYHTSHIPGAIYAHLDEDLSGPIIPGQTSRHPLPDPIIFVQTASHWGIDETAQVVVYDAVGGAYAARLWWMLRYAGHQAVAVLDGGWPGWVRLGYPTESGTHSRPERVFKAHPRLDQLLHADEVLNLLDDPTCRLLDARAADRYRGENETLDSVGGHIPGAVTAPFDQNLDENQHFLDPATLKARYTELLGDVPAEKAVVYCGSGVTANHNILAMLHAGLGEARLYAGSWSEWITDPTRPVAIGDDGA